MNDSEPDLDDVTLVLKRRALRAIHPALRKLDRVARGRDAFHTEHQFRACIALARLAPHFLADHATFDPESEHPLSGPEFNTPEKLLSGARLKWLSNLTPEESARFEADCKAAQAAWEASKPPRFATGKEADEYFRTHPPRSYSEFEDECWPPELRMSTLKETPNE